ncbi:hypothetical protein AMECASPLE_034222 [Ameca splendens]|uniref:Uncharacterized protein n=1 Tax=Ameca splendens TaxID=208324 RepID=A0ABV0YVB3_9TELE
MYLCNQPSSSHGQRASRVDKIKQKLIKHFKGRRLKNASGSPTSSRSVRHQCRACSGQAASRCKDFCNQNEIETVTSPEEKIRLMFYRKNQDFSAEVCTKTSAKKT